MSAKEKAEDLIKIMLYCYQGHIDKYIAKEYALIAVDQIIDECYNWSGGPDNINWQKKRWNYWQEIKEEIEKL
jgi:hypothetical protein